MICWPCTDFLTRPNAYLPTCLPAYLPTYLPACLPICLPACLPAYLPACLPTYNAYLVQFGRGGEGAVGPIIGSY